MKPLQRKNTRRLEALEAFATPLKEQNCQQIMNDLPLLNPNGQLIPEIATRMFETRKTKPIWAKKIETKQEVETLEGRLVAGPNDFLCRGIVGEYWPQKQSKLLEKYVSSDEIDSEGWRRFDPKPEATPVEATQLAYASRVTAHRGKLTGKANDYVVRSKTDPTDIWIVDRAIFEASYEPTEPMDDSEKSSHK